MSVTQPSIFETIFNQSIASAVILNAKSPDFVVVAENSRHRLEADKQDQSWIGKGAFEVFVPEPQSQEQLQHYSNLIAAFKTCLLQKSIVKIQPVLKKAKNNSAAYEEVWLQTEVTPVLDAQGDVNLLICTSYDISKLVLLEGETKDGHLREQNLSEELAATNEELNASNEELLSSNAELRLSQESLSESNRELENRVEERTKALTESEARFRNMVEQSPIPMLVTMGDALTFDIINQPMLDLIGKDGSVIGKPWHEAMPELEGQDIIRQLLETYDSGNSWEGNEVPIMTYRAGAPVLGFYNVNYKPLVENGKTVGMLQSAIDVTELVKARLQVEENNAQLQSLNEELQSSNEEMAAANEALIEIQDQLILESAERKLATDQIQAQEENIRNIVLKAPVGMCIVQGEPLYVLEVNDIFLELIGKTRDALKSSPYWVVNAEAAPYYQPITDNVIKTGKTYFANEHEIILIRNGQEEIVHVDFVYEPMKDGHGQTYAIMIVAIDITEKVLSRRRTERAQEQLRMAIEAANLGTYAINIADFNFQASPQLKELFGFERDEIVSYEAAIHQIQEDYRQAVDTAVREAIDNNTRFEMEYPVLNHTNGSLRWIRGIGEVQHDADGKSYFAGVLHEITEQKMDEIRKNDFIGMVSHELKTPLTSLNAIIQVTNNKLKNSSDQFLASAMSKANVQVKRMTSMVNGFLNISRLESGKLLIEKSEFDMEELVKEITEEIRVTVTTHQINFSHCQPANVAADRDKINSVITNLISNAVKYSPARTTVQIACHIENNNVIVSVKDEGRGINPNDASKIFDRYYRVENSDTKHISGFGIGLYLTKEIIVRHEGKIWLDSLPGAGTTFYFSLPLNAGSVSI